jgi:hypothetical protein
MASPANRNYSPALGSRFDAYFCMLGSGLGPRHLSDARLAHAVQLDRLPDAALRQMGIARADIPRIVFRDLFSI